MPGLSWGASALAASTRHVLDAQSAARTESKPTGTLLGPLVGWGTPAHSITDIAYTTLFLFVTILGDLGNTRLGRFNPHEHLAGAVAFIRQDHLLTQQ